MPATVQVTGVQLVNIVQTVLTSVAQSDGFYRRGVLVDSAVPFIVGTTLPTTSNTGLTVSRSALTPVAAEQIHSTPGQTFMNTWFQGGAVLNAQNINYINCSFANLAGTTRAGTVTVNSGASGTFTRSEFVPHAQGDRGLFLNGITVAAGGSYTTNRCYFEGCNDGVFGYGAWADNGSLMDYFNFRTDDPNQTNDSRHPGWTHNDGFQHRGNGSITLRGTHVIGRFHPTLGAGAAFAGTLADGGPNEHNCHCVLVNPAVSTAPVTYDVQYCWFQRGENGFLLTGTQRTDNNGILKFNRFGTNTSLSYGSHHTQVAVQRSLGVLDQSGNVYWDDPVATPNAALRGTALPWGYDGSSDYSRTD